MLVFDQGNGRFNFRVAGMAIRDGHVLVHRAVHEAFWTLPGGRAEMGEETAAVLHREMREEIETDVEVGRLVWVVENFFRYEGRDFHEIGFYYAMDIERSFPFHPERIVHRIVDGKNELEFRWVRAEQEPLAALPLYPEFIPSRIDALPAATERIVWRDEIPPVNQKARLR